MALDWNSTFFSKPLASAGAAVGATGGVAQQYVAPEGAGIMPTPGTGGTPIPRNQQTAAARFDQIMPTLQAGATPDYLDLALQRATNQRNIGYAYQDQAFSADLLKQQYGLDIADANTAAQNNAIALAAAQRQPGVLEQLYGIQQGMFGLQRDQIGQQAGEQKRSLQSDATARGAMIASGTRQGYKDIYTNLVNQLRGVDLNSQQYDVNYKENQSQAQDRIKTLQNEAANLGMKPDALRNMLGTQLAKLGNSTAQSVDSLLDGIARGDIASLKLYYSLLGQAGQYMNAGG